MQNTKFLIISPARCGSTALRKALNRHGEIICHGEVFAPNRVIGLHPGVLRDFPVPPKEQLQERNRDPLQFLENILATNRRASGFKAVYNQLVQVHAAEVLDALIADSELKVVYMWRKNLCRRYLSEKKLATEYRNRDLKNRRIVITLDFNEMVQDFRNQIAMRNRYMKLFVDHDSMSICYEDMLSSDFSNGLRVFLGVENGEITLSDQKEDYSSSIEVVVENQEELLAKYEGIKEDYEAE